MTWNCVKTKVFRFLIKLPYIRGIVQKELGGVDKTITDKCREMFGGQAFIQELPEKGQNSDQLLQKFDTYAKLSKIDFKKGRVSGTVYFDMGEELSNLVTKIYGLTAYSNPLHPEVFPGINKMEAEIVRMTINLFNGDEDCCGVVTSGGTESIVLAVKAYRDYALEVRGIRKPELVAPVTAHAAFQKSCQYFNIKLISVPVDKTTYKVDLNRLKRSISSNTILLVGSACGYPHGIVDDIEAIGKVD